MTKSVPCGLTGPQGQYSKLIYLDRLSVLLHN